MVVKGFTKIRHLKTEGGAFNEFLLAATTPEEVSAFHKQTRKTASSHIPLYGDHSTSDTNTTFTLTNIHHLNSNNFSGQNVGGGSYLDSGHYSTKQEPMDYASIGEGQSTYQMMSGGQQYINQQMGLGMSHEMTQQQQQMTGSANPTPTKQRKVPTISTGRRCLKEEKVNPDEAIRRAKRRERNRLAAAKCRKKRQDQIEILSTEVSELENSNSEIENEVQELLNEKTRLLFFLQAHKMECREPSNLRIPALPQIHLEVSKAPRHMSQSSEQFDETESCLSSSSAGLDSSFNGGSGGTPAQRPNDLSLPPLHTLASSLSSLNTPTFPMSTPCALPTEDPSNTLTTLSNMSVLPSIDRTHNNNNSIKAEPNTIDYTNL